MGFFTTESVDFGTGACVALQDPEGDPVAADACQAPAGAVEVRFYAGADCLAGGLLIQIAVEPEHLEALEHGQCAAVSGGGRRLGAKFEQFTRGSGFAPCAGRGREGPGPTFDGSDFLTNIALYGSLQDCLTNQHSLGAWFFNATGSSRQGAKPIASDCHCQGGLASRAGNSLAMLPCAGDDDGTWTLGIFDGPDCDAKELVQFSMSREVMRTPHPPSEGAGACFPTVTASFGDGAVPAGTFLRMEGFVPLADVGARAPLPAQPSVDSALTLFHDAGCSEEADKLAFGERPDLSECRCFAVSASTGENASLRICTEGEDEQASVRLAVFSDGPACAGSATTLRIAADGVANFKAGRCAPIGALGGRMGPFDLHGGDICSC
mmetsp:Transcript_121694/g.349796  ORF Transcript_121694/g.349796 Transcript_121694/m.349796 type:complete len:380 (-) Transcript_121694:87-1226(-)